MKIAVIGLGYVGLPLAMVFAEAGVEVVGIEAVAARCDEVNAGRSYIQDVRAARPSRRWSTPASCTPPPTTPRARIATPTSSACRRR